MQSLLTVTYLFRMSGVSLSLTMLAGLTVCNAASSSSAVSLNTLQLNGSAQLTSPTSITLTDNYYQAGSAFVPTPFSFPAGASFYACFFYQAQAPASAIPADGLAFVVENLGIDSPAYLALSGSGLGFFTLSYYPAIAVSVDYYVNALTGSQAGTLAIATTSGTELAQTVPSLPVLPGDGYFRGIWVRYNDNTRLLTVYYGNTTTQPATPALTTTLATSLSTALNGQVYFGITAGTGALYSIQQLRYFAVEVVSD